MHNMEDDIMYGAILLSKGLHLHASICLLNNLQVAAGPGAVCPVKAGHIIRHIANAMTKHARNKGNQTAWGGRRTWRGRAGGFLKVKFTPMKEIQKWICPTLYLQRGEAALDHAGLAVLDDLI